MQEDLLQYLSDYCADLHGLGFVYKLLDKSTDHTAVVEIRTDRDGDTFKCEAELPLPDMQGIYTLDRNRVIIVPRLLGKPYKFNEMRVISSFDTYMSRIRESLRALAYRLIHFGIWDEDVVTSQVAAFFSNSPYIRLVSDYMRQCEFKALSRTVVLEGGGPAPSDRLPGNWAGLVDPYTSPTSEKVGLVYQLADGVEINKDGKLTKGSHVLSQMNKENSIFPLLAPTQLYKVKSTFMRHLPLVSGEHPFVRSTEYSGDLSGQHLLTALMADRFNQHDAITISRSAAVTFNAYLHKSQVILSRAPIKMSCKIGDTVSAGQMLAVALKYDNGLDDFEKKSIKQNKLQGDAEVIDISHEESITGGVLVYRTRVLLRCVEPMQDGDKIITRHGAKGVVRILQDDSMPLTEDGRRIDVIVNPVSVVSRKNWAMFAEAAYYDKGIDEDRPFVPVDPDETPVWDYLLKNGYGKKEQLCSPSGTKYEHKTFCGHIYWLRTDSIAKYRISTPKSNSKNFLGLESDVSTLSGSRVDITMRQILWAKGLKKLDALMFKKHFSERAAELAKTYMDMLFQRIDVSEITKQMDEEEVHVTEMVDELFKELELV